MSERQDLAGVWLVFGHGEAPGEEFAEDSKEWMNEGV